MTATGRLALGLALAACTLRPAGAQGLPPGNGHQTVTFAGTPLQLYTYRPICTPRLVLIVFHGVERNPGPYRDHARPLADRVCAAIVAPEFDRARFPRDLYQYGGAGLRPEGERSIDLMTPLLAWATSAAQAPAVLLGHSAGSQYLDRVAAYAPPPGVPMIIANPSTWVLPTATPAPFGFGDLPPAAIRAYLALPITILLGGTDTGTRNLAMSPEAMAQGPDRLARGQNAFAQAEALARARGWPFNWHLAIVPGVGHDAARMFASDQAAAALPR